MSLEEKLQTIRDKSRSHKIKIMIMGLGSVGHYLLDYLLSGHIDDIEIIVVGRNYDKMISNVNISKIASLIRHQNRTQVIVEPDIDFDSIESIQKCISFYLPDIIVNSSRAYPGLKYGTISWKNFRAYGIWAPLSIRFVKNIMDAIEGCNSKAIVINTSYSDAVIAWLRSAGKSYPDFGSGNVNHLVPRVKYAISDIKGIPDYWNIEVKMAISHFHDVVISKEGQTEGVDPLIVARYGGKVIDVDYRDVFSRCSIPMPVDAKRNMMNASSNYEIIDAIIGCVRDGKRSVVHIPGAFGYIGGYPVVVDGSEQKIRAFVDESDFSIEDMVSVNSKSIYMDGIEKIEDGTLYYTDELRLKVKNAFGVDLMKSVPFAEIEKAADFLIKNIIEKQVQKGKKDDQ